MVHVAVVLGAAALMFLISEVCASLLPATLQPLSSIPGQDSLATSVLSDILFTFTMVALAEELMKFVGYTEFKEYYKKLGNGKALLIALIPVALWAGFHAIQAYNNIWYVIPAFVDGMILIALLEYTKAFLAPVIAHGCYNAILILLGYVSTPAGLPFLPRIVTASDFFLIVLCLLWLLLGIVVPVYLSQKRCSF
jgi:membrane protease YdiL (CAAX protease family)